MKHLGFLRRLPHTTLIALHVAVVFAGFLSPYDPAKQNRASALLPPMAVHFFDSRGVFHARPFVTAAPADRVYPIRFLVSGAPYRVVGLWNLQTHLLGVDEPGRVFLLGTDEFGRDQLSRLLWGGQVSLAIGWLAAFLALTIGLIVGSVAGFFGGWRDAILMRAVELFLALPWLYLLLAVRAILPLSMSPRVTALVVAAIIGAVGWARPARLIRGIVLSARERDYVLAARGFGGSSWYLVCRHCLPETYGVLATQAALLVPQYVLAEVTLSFAGFGVADPDASWGNLLTPLRQVSLLTAGWWLMLPVVVLIATAWCFLRVEDSLTNADRSN